VNEIPRPAMNIDVGSVIANAKSLLDQEEREVEHLMTSMIENEVQAFYLGLFWWFMKLCGLFLRFMPL
jgi:hypothetical protein